MTRTQSPSFESHQTTIVDPVLLFDGVCSLCAGSVRFVLDHERDHAIRFAPLQSPTGRGLLAEHGLVEPGESLPLSSVVLIEGGRAFVRSDAVLRVCRHLRAPYRWAWWFRVLPRWVRDAAYRVVAKHRYRLFGQETACLRPPEGQEGRFLDFALHTE